MKRRHEICLGRPHYKNFPTGMLITTDDNKKLYACELCDRAEYTIRQKVYSFCVRYMEYVVLENQQS